jgi:transposase-like protein
MYNDRMAKAGQTTKVGQDKSEIVADIPRACADERAAVEFLEKQRWGDTPCCPRCGDTDVSQMKSKTGERNARFLWRCNGCKRQFTVRIGTVFEDSRIPLRHWCYAFWRACSSKKGVSALEIKRQTGLSYKSALFMMHRIRYAMTEDYAAPPKMQGTIEADETYVGGKPRNRRSQPQRTLDRIDGKPVEKWTTKIPVVGLVERGGNVRAFPMPEVTAANLKRAIDEHVDKTRSRLMTDEHRGYCPVGSEFAGGHHTVTHSRGEYARGDVTTNTIEGFFGLLKRGLNGTFHAVSKRHLHRYLNEFAFRYNTRKDEDGERTRKAIQGAVGKRLVYREPVTQPVQ